MWTPGLDATGTLLCKTAPPGSLEPASVRDLEERDLIQFDLQNVGVRRQSTASSAGRSNPNQGVKSSQYTSSVLLIRKGCLRCDSDRELHKGSNSSAAFTTSDIQADDIWTARTIEVYDRSARPARFLKLEKVKHKCR